MTRLVDIVQNGRGTSLSLKTGFAPSKVLFATCKQIKRCFTVLRGMAASTLKPIDNIRVSLRLHHSTFSFGKLRFLTDRLWTIRASSCQHIEMKRLLQIQHSVQSTSIVLNGEPHLR